MEQEAKDKMDYTDLLHSNYIKCTAQKSQQMEALESKTHTQKPVH